MPDELRHSYHRQLGAIDSIIIRMLAIVEEDIAAAGSAFLGPDREAADAVEAHKPVLQELYADVERLVQLQLVRQAPVAGELRFLLTVLRMLPELERSDALAAHVARRGATLLAAELPPRVRGLISQLVEGASTMWHQVAAAYASQEPGLAAEIEAADDDLDELHASLSAELVSAELRAPVLLEMGLVARFLERLGDHAVNVAQWIETFDRPRSTTIVGLVTPPQV
ncbi:MAG: phosphate signaling complex protein PhoU [Acidimicrobiales bacterium]